MAEASDLPRRRNEAAYRALLRQRHAAAAAAAAAATAPVTEPAAAAAVQNPVRSWLSGAAAVADTARLLALSSTLGLEKREKERLRKRQQRARQKEKDGGSVAKRTRRTQPLEGKETMHDGDNEGDENGGDSGDADSSSAAVAAAVAIPLGAPAATLFALSAAAALCPPSPCRDPLPPPPSPPLVLPPLASMSVVRRRDGSLAKIVYAVHANADHRMARHVVPDDIVQAIGSDTLEQLCDHDTHQYGFERMDADAHSATERCDYSLIESHAVPFYLEHLFDRRDNVFSLCPIPLALLEQLLLELRRLGDSSMTRVATSDTASSSSPPLPFNGSPRLKQAWSMLTDCDILCVPSVLLLSNVCTTNEWLDLLRQLERHTNLHVFPDLAVESEMENKERYLLRLMTPLPAVPTPIEHTKSGTVNLFHVPHNLHLPPTVILPSFAQMEKHLTRVESLALLHECMQRLNAEVTEGGWQVRSNQWVVKGTNSTRSNVMEICTTAAQMLRFMQAAYRTPAATAAADASTSSAHQQIGYILQPFLLGLTVEARSWLHQGHQHQLTLLTEQVSDKRHSTAIRTWEIRGGEAHRLEHHAYSTCLPQLLAFDQRVLQVCEAHCRLVSRSGLLRVDTGVEFLDASGVAEDDLRARQHRPEQWHVTGQGHLVRFFCNEVTSTLDINWFSGQTTAPIVYTAAYACAQQLVQRLQTRASAGLIK